MSEQRDCAPDKSSSVSFFSLRAGQCQSIIHVTLAVQNGLKTHHSASFPVLTVEVKDYTGDCGHLLLNDS